MLAVCRPATRLPSIIPTPRRIRRIPLRLCASTIRRPLPLANTATRSERHCRWYRFFRRHGLGHCADQCAFAGTGMTASNPSGTTLEVLDDGAGNTVDVNSLSTTSTVTGTRSAALPSFRCLPTVRRLIPGRLPRAARESVGLAGPHCRKSGGCGRPVRPWSRYQPGTAAGDSTRPNFILQQLTGASLTFSSNTGIGTAGSAILRDRSPLILRQVISQQGEAATSATNLKQGQDVVLNSLQQRFNDTSGVNVDQEMANLLTLQNSYAANAHVLSASRICSPP